MPAELMNWPVLATAGTVAVGAGVGLGLRVARWRVARRTARSRRLGVRGEALGRRVLERHGYRVLREQVTGSVRLRVDGELQTFVVRADALVARGRRRYVAELKGGPAVATVEHRGTRRQLLEYAHAFDVDGVVLVDGPGGTIEHVEWTRV